MMRLSCGKSVPSGELVRAARESSLGGELLLCPEAAPLHPTSIAAFFGSLKPDTVNYFVPVIPVSSELGLPKYDPLMIWVPDHVSVPREELLKRPFAPLRLGREAGVVFHRVEGASMTEQEHYFVDHFGSVSARPVQVSVVVSNRCNLSCVMCPYHGKKARSTHARDYFSRPEFMDRDLLFSIAGNVGRLGAPVKVGNIEEPLLHPDMAEFIRRAREAGSPSAHITTNGVLLTEERADALLDAGLTSIYISLDAALPDTYARIRGGDLAKVESQVLSFIEKAKRRSPDFAVFTSCVLNDGLDRDEVERFAEKWCASSDGAIFYNLGTYNGGSTSFSSIHAVAQNKIQESGKRWPCLNPWQEIYILPDGQCLYCCETLSRLAHTSLQSMGDVPETPLSEIWLGKPFSDLRRALIRNDLGQWPACDKCNIWMAHVAETEDKPTGKVVRNMITEIRYAR
ncbi:MoaA/NifB/PqqE/SkfB family radical SAM enzyme [Desulfomicrobium macestii]|uniref:MoaA/NifB/PqqE/SkfB family radical SAM enzyme n=1 Tax=Desulfomicrobium macestii TaxID=90731 RepID=A0ABR9H6R0_9BACT|nr:radical SAM protein [Desulfomicrobium macestii]MBE1426401.1 MoaA/NifB/PqqE/SkfB family radical SAM enzyme [Desulfomicrobium macestii]